MSMPAAKSMTETAEGPEAEVSSIVTTMARNGTDFGIRLAGFPGEWFTAPAGKVQGLFFPGFSEADANLDIGNSTITETAGFGGFAMAAAPAITKFVGGIPANAVEVTQEIYEICFAESDLGGSNWGCADKPGQFANWHVAHCGGPEASVGITYPPIAHFV
jgi:hypothetical protein